MSAPISQKGGGRHRSWLRVIACMAICISTVMSWEKYDFCCDWASHYEKSALQIRADAADPLTSRSDVHECLIVAEWQKIIARKYRWAAVTLWPFGSYPKAPLVSKHEQVEVLKNLPGVSVFHGKWRLN